MMFLNGLLLNSIQFIAHFELYTFSEYTLNVIALCLLLSFWLTSVIPVCYIIAILYDKVSDL